MKFITFNYDRVLEQFLFESIKSLYNIKEDEAKILMNSIQIVHLHGRLAPLTWEDQEEGTDYGYSLTDAELHYRKTVESAKRIKIIHEAIEEDGFEEAKRILRNGRGIYLIGYGYHTLNNSRLGLNQVERGMLGTTFGLTKNEVGMIKKKDQLTLLKDVNENNLDFIRMYFNPS